MKNILFSLILLFISQTSFAAKESLYTTNAPAPIGTVYLTDLSNFSRLNDAMNKSFQTPYPARSVIEVKGIPKNSMVEIEAVMQK